MAIKVGVSGFGRIARVVIRAAMDMPEIFDDMYEKSKDAIAYAKEKNVPLHLAQVSNAEDLKLGIERGFTGFQCRTSHCIL